MKPTQGMMMATAPSDALRTVSDPKTQGWTASMTSTMGTNRSATASAVISKAPTKMIIRSTRIDRTAAITMFIMARMFMPSACTTLESKAAASTAARICWRKSIASPRPNVYQMTPTSTAAMKMAITMTAPSSSPRRRRSQCAGGPETEPSRGAEHVAAWAILMRSSEVVEVALVGQARRPLDVGDGVGLPFAPERPAHEARDERHLARVVADDRDGDELVPFRARTVDTRDLGAREAEEGLDRVVDRLLGALRGAREPGRLLVGIADDGGTHGLHRGVAHHEVGQEQAVELQEPPEEDEEGDDRDGVLDVDRPA